MKSAKATPLKSAMPPDVTHLVQGLHNIWDNKALGLVYTLYAHNVSIHTDTELYGHEPVMSDIIRTLASFPDAVITADSTIWEDDSADNTWVSYRFQWSGHHQGYGDYGAPTQQPVESTGIIHAQLHGKRVQEAWVVGDKIALAGQLGLQPTELIQQLRAQQQSSVSVPSTHTSGELARSYGQRPPVTEVTTPRKPEETIRLLYDQVWNGRMLNALAYCYAPEATIHTTQGRTLQGTAELTQHLLQLLAAFPDAVIQFDQLLRMGNQLAARWTFQGTHGGNGMYGLPTGKRVRFTGLSQFECQAEKIQQEYTFWDELALLQQLSSLSLPDTADTE